MSYKPKPLHIPKKPAKDCYWYEIEPEPYSPANIKTECGHFEGYTKYPPWAKNWNFCMFCGGRIHFVPMNKAGNGSGNNKK